MLCSSYNAAAKRAWPASDNSRACTVGRALSSAPGLSIQYGVFSPAPHVTESVYILLGRPEQEKQQMAGWSAPYWAVATVAKAVQTICKSSSSTLAVR